MANNLSKAVTEALMKMLEGDAGGMSETTERARIDSEEDRINSELREMEGALNAQYSAVGGAYTGARMGALRDLGVRGIEAKSRARAGIMQEGDMMRSSALSSALSGGLGQVRHDEQMDFAKKKQDSDERRWFYSTIANLAGKAI